MSRIGNEPVILPDNVEADISGTEVTVKGPKGTLTRKFQSSMKILEQDGSIKVVRSSDEREQRAFHGLTRSLIANMVKGVSEGFSKTLDLVGVGYRVQMQGSGLTLSVMLSHPVEIDATSGITFEVEGNNRIHVRGIDKQRVGQMAAEIRSVRPPNAYTGKGIRYADEQVRIKPGKSARRVQ